MEDLDVSNAPQIHEGWIYSMVVLGIMGCFILFGIILISGYNTYNIIKQKSLYKPLIILNFMIWSSNFMACIGWGFLRTNLFHSLSKQKCIAIYIFNYLFFMIAKYSIHILLLWRLFVTFKNTAIQINEVFIKILLGVITINFIVLTCLWLNICFKNVTVGISVQSEMLQICTLYNGISNKKYSVYDEIWPIIFGGEDFFVGLITLIIFIKKINDSSANPQKHDVELEILIRKLTVLGSIAICSTFIFYTFAVPFYPNLTFLLPFDAILNSLCIILLLEYTTKCYLNLCCCLDKLLRKTLNHQTMDEIALRDTISNLKIIDTASNGTDGSDVNRVNVDVANNKNEDIKETENNTDQNEDI